ncbi:MAG: hypothetical protein WKG01_25750 [Kofleriaceae bacterium]
MSRFNSAIATPEPSAAPPVEDAGFTELENLLLRAADLAVQRGLDVEAFLAGSWDAFVSAKPGLREQLEDKELKAQLKRLRKRGLVASA